MDDGTPFYVPKGDEVEIFWAAYKNRLPLLLEGPTGTGKTRFLEHMVHRVRDRGLGSPSLTTISCHADLTATDLVGRFHLARNETTWIDGPLTAAVRNGHICYLDELVEARSDTTVVIHPLTDHRRILPIEKLATTIEAHPNFQLVISYNPGYRNAWQHLKESTRQRFVAIPFSYPSPETEKAILEGEAGAPSDLADRLANLAFDIRSLENGAAFGVEGPSSRLLIHTARLVASGIPARKAARAAIADVLTDEEDLRDAIGQLIDLYFTD